jgi:hypothetical protein
LKIDEQAYVLAGRAQIVDTLRQALVSKSLGALQFHNESIFDGKIRNVLAHYFALIEHS